MKTFSYFKSVPTFIAFLLFVSAICTACQNSTPTVIEQEFRQSKFYSINLRAPLILKLFCVNIYA